MGAKTEMLHLNLKKKFYYRFDLTKKTPTPPVKILWVQTVNVTPQLKKFFFITDLTNFDPPPPK